MKKIIEKIKALLHNQIFLSLVVFIAFFVLVLGHEIVEKAWSVTAADILTKVVPVVALIWGFYVILIKSGELVTRWKYYKNKWFSK